MKQTPPLTSAQQALVEENLPLVRWLIKEYIKINESIPGLGYDDVFQEGSLALCHAAATYQPQYNQFGTYAFAVIHNHLIEYCRRILSRMTRYPASSLDAPAGDDPSGEDRIAELTAPDMDDDWNSRILVSQVLEHGKRNYGGIAKLGVEALELKIQGYRGTDIAKLYGAKSNDVFAWISRAQKKLREDPVACGLLDRQIA